MCKKFPGLSLVLTLADILNKDITLIIALGKKGER